MIPGKTREQLRESYLKALHKVIDESDIIMLVFDGRDPKCCRSRLVEEGVPRSESGRQKSWSERNFRKIPLISSMVCRRKKPQLVESSRLRTSRDQGPNVRQELESK